MTHGRDGAGGDRALGERHGEARADRSAQPADDGVREIPRVAIRRRLSSPCAACRGAFTTRANLARASWRSEAAELAIEAACSLIDGGRQVLSIGTAEPDDTISEIEVARIYAIWARRRSRSAELRNTMTRTVTKCAASRAMKRDKSSDACPPLLESDDRTQNRSALALGVVTARISAMPSHIGTCCHHFSPASSSIRRLHKRRDPSGPRRRHRNDGFPKFRIPAILAIIRRTGVVWVTEAAGT